VIFRARWLLVQCQAFCAPRVVTRSCRTSDQDSSALAGCQADHLARGRLLMRGSAPPFAAGSLAAANLTFSSACRQGSICRALEVWFLTELGSRVLDVAADDKDTLIASDSKLSGQTLPRRTVTGRVADSLIFETASRCPGTPRGPASKSVIERADFRISQQPRNLTDA
jgi:hypothetical protein